jgi:predicted O-methyltransferase YrrM
VFGVYKRCGFFTHDEAAILYNIARQVGGGSWLDIGGLTGWTAAHLSKAGCSVTSVDPMYTNLDFLTRTTDNLREAGCAVGLVGCTSNLFFADDPDRFDGIGIDGDHESPRPLQDAINAAERTTPDGVIVLHDMIFPGPQEAWMYLNNKGWKTHGYKTPHRLTVCWRGGSVFVPPYHVPDPGVHV